MSKKTVIWSAIALTAAGIVGWTFLSPREQAEPETVAVRRGDIVEVVSETGSVVAMEDLDLHFETTGRVAEVLVEEGDEVEEGDAIMRLRTADLAIRRQDAVALLRSAEARYLQAQAGVTVEQIALAETAVRNAEVSLAARERALNDLLATNEAALEKAYSDLSAALETLYLESSTAMQTLRNDVFDATGTMRQDFLVTDSFGATKASNDYEVARTALSEVESDIADLRFEDDRASIDVLALGIIARSKSVRDAVASANAILQTSLPRTITQTELDARKSRVQTAWTKANASVHAAESARLAVSSTKAANAKAENAALKEIDVAELAVKTAQQDLARLQAPLRDVDAAVHLAAIASARANLSLIDQQIADATLRAPLPGRVVSLDLDLGELATPSMRAATLVSSVFEIESEVSELDINRVRVGQPVEVMFDAIEGETYRAVVADIAPRETIEGDDIYYLVVVRLEEEALIRLGMTADLDIIVGTRENVLLVPRRQVIRRDGSDFVRLLTEKGVTEEREVRVGLRGRDDYEILSGVSEGERVVIE